MQEIGVVLPLDELIKSRDNVYERTCAAIKRAIQINLAGDEELVDNKGKIVSTAVKQILSNKVQYRLED